MREWEIGAVENIHWNYALPYIRFAPILALVGVGVNRIGKFLSSSLSTLSQHRDPCAGPRSSTPGATEQPSPVPAPPRQADRHDRRASRSSRPQRYRCRTRRSRPGTGHAPPPGRPGRGRAGAPGPFTPKPPNSASSRRSRMPKRRSRSARSANAPRPGLRPLTPRSRSSSGNTASSVHPEAATVSPAPANTARTRYRKPLPPRTPRERR